MLTRRTRGAQGRGAQEQVHRGRGTARTGAGHGAGHGAGRAGQGHRGGTHRPGARRPALATVHRTRAGQSFVVLTQPTPAPDGSPRVAPEPELCAPEHPHFGPLHKVVCRLQGCFVNPGRARSPRLSAAFVPRLPRLPELHHAAPVVRPEGDPDAPVVVGLPAVQPLQAQRAVTRPRARGSGVRPARPAGRLPSCPRWRGGGSGARSLRAVSPSWCQAAGPTRTGVRGETARASTCGAQDRRHAARRRADVTAMRRPPVRRLRARWVGSKARSGRECSPGVAREAWTADFAPPASADRGGRGSVRPMPVGGGLGAAGEPRGSEAGARVGKLPRASPLPARAELFPPASRTTRRRRFFFSARLPERHSPVVIATTPSTARADSPAKWERWCVCRGRDPRGWAGGGEPSVTAGPWCFGRRRQGRPARAPGGFFCLLTLFLGTSDTF